MGKKKLADLLEKEQFSSEDIGEIAQIVKENPYFQAGRAILAKGVRDSENKNAKAYTNVASVYTTERHQLKLFFNNLLFASEVTQETETFEPTVEESVSTENGKAQVSSNSTDHLPKDQLEQLYKEIEENIKEIEENKAKFLAYDAPIKKNTASKSKNSKTSTTKKASASTSETTNKSQEKKVTRTRQKKKTPEVVEESPKILEELSQKSELEVKNKVTKKQIEIIDNFLSNPIELKAAQNKEVLEPIKDLSANSVEAREDLVSENLANILLKQGKKDKAIDLFKKLIWKYPKKKTYFAARIEEIKKE